MGLGQEFRLLQPAFAAIPLCGFTYLLTIGGLPRQIAGPLGGFGRAKPGPGRDFADLVEVHEYRPAADPRDGLPAIPNIQTPGTVAGTSQGERQSMAAAMICPSSA